MTNITIKEAKNYIIEYFKYNLELNTWAFDSGTMTKKDIKDLSEDQLLDIAEDIKYQVRCEIGY